RLGADGRADLPARPSAATDRACLGAYEAAAPLAEEPADESNQHDRNDHAHDERPEAAEDQACDYQRCDADQDRDDPAHRVPPRMKEPAEGADKRTYENEPYPVHGEIGPRRCPERNLRASEKLGLLGLELLVGEDAVAAELVQLPKLVGHVVPRRGPMRAG